MDKNLRHKLKVILGGGWRLNFPEFKHIEDILLVNGYKNTINPVMIFTGVGGEGNIGRGWSGVTEVGRSLP